MKEIKFRAFHKESDKFYDVLTIDFDNKVCWGVCDIKKCGGCHWIKLDYESLEQYNTGE